MVNETLPVGIVVEVTRNDCNFLGKIVEVSATHVMDDVWYLIETLPGEQGAGLQEKNGGVWFQQKHVSTIDLLVQ